MGSAILCSVEMEATAEAGLRVSETWAEFAGSDKRTCIASTVIGGFASYVELLVCLQIARDVHDDNNRPHSPQTTTEIRP